MASGHPELLVRSHSSAGLILTITVSALVHLVVIVLFSRLPHRPVVASRPLESYTVDLLAPASIGGTNLTAGKGAGSAPAAPIPKPVTKDEPKPLAVAKEAAPAKQVPAIVVKPKGAAAAKPPPAESEPKPAEKAAAEAKPVPAPKPKDETKPDPVVSKSRPVEKVKDKPKPVPALEKSQVVPPKKALVVAPKNPPQEAKPKVEKPAVVRAVDAPETKPDKAVSVPPREDSPRKIGQPEKASEGQSARSVPSSKDELDAKIAKAVADRAAKADASAADDVINAAIRRRVAQQIAVGSGAASDRAGPVSYGPGSGAGGAVRDLEYIAYRSQMEARIKGAWAWAGANRSLVAVIGFNITPAGEIINVHTVQASGDSSYDASAERAVRSASPLGPIPEKYQAEFWGVELEFRPEEGMS